MGRSEQTTIGRAGEYLAAHILETAGIEAYRVDGDFDLILNIDGALVRMEVKASSKKTSGRNLYRFYIENRNADIYAFVALDIGLMRLRMTSELSASGEISYGPARFTPDNQAADIARLVETFGGKPKP